MDFSKKQNIQSTKEDIKRTGVDTLGEFYINKLFEGIEELSKTQDELLVENQIEDFGIEQFPTGFAPYNGIWRYEPVDSKYFCNKFLGESPTAKQQEFFDIICGKDPFEFSNVDYNEADLMWGKGSGKDSTTAKVFAFQSYKLCCLINPQKYLGLGLASPIDLVNVAATGEQAQNIFFKYLVAFIKGVKDPDTGYNWFASRNFWWDTGKRDFKYMDLRERDGNIKTKTIEFGRQITCHSLTSERFTAEGKTLILAVMDEVGAMRPENVFGVRDGTNDNKMVGQHRSLGTSLRRSSKFSKLVCISYKYGANCPMTILVRRNKDKPNKFVRIYSTYEVRTDKSEKELRLQFADDYRDDPEIAKMMYECVSPDTRSDVFNSNPFIIKGSIDSQKKYCINPFKNNLITTTDIHLGVDGLLESWFKGDDKYFYSLHADLAKGQVWRGGDAGALVMGHLEEIRVHYDKAWMQFYKKNYGIDLSEYQGQLRVGVVIDLAIQLTCTREQKELQISSVRRFMVDLQEKRNFNLIKATLDRWGSQETLQELDKVGVDCGLLSMDKSYEPWHTQKDYQQQNIFKMYPNKIWEREMSELIDTGKKIDHPEKSIVRFETEGYENGSKDIADCTAGVTHNLVQELVNNGEVFFA